LSTLHHFPTRRSSDLKSCTSSLIAFVKQMFLLVHPETTDIPDRILLPRMVPSSKPFFLEENHLKTSCIHLFLIDYNIFWLRCYLDRKSTRLNSSHVSI